MPDELRTADSCTEMSIRVVKLPSPLLCLHVILNEPLAEPDYRLKI